MSRPQATPAEPSLAERARKVLPGGGLGNVSSPVVIREGRGGRVWDTDGNEYVDFLLGSGPMLIGHCNPEVNAAVEEQLQHGTTFFASNEHCIALAEEIVAATPCADKLRYVSTGSEATLYAMRVARAHRRRDRVLKFEGGYHGMSDYSLQSLAPKHTANFPQAVPDSAGIPRPVGDEMLIAPYNDAETAVGMIEEYADDLAAVIVEPFQRVIAPVPGFLEALREATARLGVVLIFDEVVSGFRLAYGSGQAYYGVTPDLCSLGKVIGGGFPLAAVAGSEAIMSHFDAGAVAPEDFTPQIGTLSGNPIASVAGLATLEILRRPGAYEGLFATGRTLMEGLAAALDGAGVPSRVVGVPPCFDVVFTEGEIRNYRDFVRGDAGKMRRFNEVLREHGIFKGDSKFYVSLAHDEADVRQTLDAFEAAAAVLA